MTISRVRPGGFIGTGSELLASEVRGIDRRFNLQATDKTGDTITGNLVINGTIAIAGTFVQGGTLLTSGSTWDDVNHLLEFSGGAAVFNVGSSTSAVLSISGAGTTLQTVAGGRIRLNDNDYPLLNTRTIHSMVDISSIADVPTSAVGWDPTVDGVATSKSDATSPLLSPSTLAVPFPRSILINNAVLTGVEVFYVPAAGNNPASGVAPQLPAVFPSFAITQRALTAGVPIGTRTSLASATDSTSDATDYRSGKVRSVSISLSHTVDLTTTYALAITPESGAGALFPCTFTAVRLTFSVTDMGFA